MTVLESTYAMVQLLSEKDLQVIKTVVEALLEKSDTDIENINNSQRSDALKEGLPSEALLESFYQPQTEEQLLQRIDLSIEHCKQGLSRDGHEVVAELRSEFDV